MNIGVAATSLTFLALTVSTTAYLLYYFRKEDDMLKMARLAFYASAFLILFQSFLLMWGLLSHQFQWKYVQSYSSTELPLFYLISTFWAGQEGTFMLWLLLGSLYSLFILRKHFEDEALAMTFVNLVQAFIVLILIRQNPFAYVWDVNPAIFRPDMIPVNGSGLNPLLQDPWMVIHPPVLFAGYASTVILFAFAMVALIRRNYDNWIKVVYPYTLFSALTLGAGIILGAYWSYTTLGWGGYWGWDPVENASLIPWLLVLVLFHGLIIQRRQGGLKKTNIAMALLSFILVLYGTFLTRSGVLTDFSVHSFGTSDLNLYLVGFILLFLVMGAMAFILRAAEVKGSKVQTALFTRESFIFFGMLVLLILSLLTFLGTSSPIITGIVGTASNVSTSFYNLISIPVAIFMLVFVSLAPVLRWKSESFKGLKSIITHAVVSVVLGAVFWLLGMRDLWPLIISMLAVFAVLVNGQIIYTLLRHKKYNFGAYLTHVGLGLMVIGIVTSSVYDTSLKTTFPLGKEKEALGYKITYNGRIPSPDGKDKVAVKINGKELFAKYYWSDYSRAFMIAPAVSNSVLRDVYLAPIQIISENDEKMSTESLDLIKGEKAIFQDWQFLFKDYDMRQHEMQSGDVRVNAVVDVYGKDGSFLETIEPGLIFSGNKHKYEHVHLPGSERKVFLTGVNVDKKLIKLAISKESGNEEKEPERLAAEISVKPLISILWLGTVLLILGFFLSMFQRRKN